MSNYPDDWGSYYTMCPNCGSRYHMSGADPCDCVGCDLCAELVPPDVAETNAIDEVVLCDACAEKNRCSWCGKISLDNLILASDGEKYCPGECLEKGTGE